MNRKINLEEEIINKILAFATLIHEKNQKLNITGFKIKEQILTELILKSIDPLRDIIVPRGTRFIDLGSGAGIPGIALSIYFNNFSGVLIESNQKKADFLKSTIDFLGLSNLEVVCERAEIFARHKEYREAFSWCFARAFGKLYAAIEIGAPFIRQNGFLYIYSNESSEIIPLKIIKHSQELGLHVMSHKEHENLNLSNKGICFKKERNTPDEYPRRFAVIKREAERIEEM